MHESVQEEIVGALWAICSLLAFTNGYNVWGWVFFIKSAFDISCSIRYAAISCSVDNKEGK